MKTRVLVTAIGTMTSTEIVCQLKNTGLFHIIGADIYDQNQIATSKDVDEFYVFPPSVVNLENYIEFTVQFCAEHKIDIYFATIDEEIANLSKNRKRFEEIGVKLCIPNHSLVMTCHYKNTFVQWLEDNMPEVLIKTYPDVQSIPEDGFPVFIKPIEGRASIGCQKVESRKQLDELAGKGLDVCNYVIQQYVGGDVITVDLVRNAATKQMTQVQRLETIRNGNGCGTAVEIIHDPVLQEICFRLMELLDLNGVVNAEFFRNKDSYQIIEVNPRFSAGSGFTCRAGVNTVLAAVSIAQGRECQFGTVAYGKHFSKRYETYEMD